MPDKGVQPQAVRFTAGGNEEGAGTLEDSLVVTKANVLLPDDPAGTLLGVYPKDLHTYFHRKTSHKYL